MPGVSAPFPILYSFRRCPFAIRARMALLQAGVVVELREVSLKRKPEALLLASPAATVPVLDRGNGDVLVHSVDIMRWGLSYCDPDQWLTRGDTVFNHWVVRVNDGEFKHWLDRTKYAERYPDRPRADYRHEATRCLITPLEARLATAPQLGGNAPCWADVAVFPFVRQFAAVDADWWRDSPYPATRRWLQGWLGSALFLASMESHSAWSPGDPRVMLAPRSGTPG
jgi:glutathione S-transferase